MGHRDRAVIEFRQSTPTDQRVGTHVVVTMADGHITAMKEYRRGRRAHRIARTAA